MSALLTSNITMSVHLVNPLKLGAMLEPHGIEMVEVVLWPLEAGPGRGLMVSLSEGYKYSRDHLIICYLVHLVTLF